MKIRKKCRSISSPCYACVNAIETKKKEKDVQTKIEKMRKVCKKVVHPADNSCECKLIGPLRSKITRLQKNL